MKPTLFKEGVDWVWVSSECLSLVVPKSSRERLGRSALFGTRGCAWLSGEHTEGTYLSVPVTIITTTPNQKWLLEVKWDLPVNRMPFSSWIWPNQWSPKFTSKPFFWTILSGFFWNDQQMMPEEFTKTFHPGGGKPQIKCGPCRASVLGGFLASTWTFLSSLPLPLNFIHFPSLKKESFSFSF